MNKKMRRFCHCNYMEFTTVWVEANTQNRLPSSCHRCPRCGAALYADGGIGPAYDALAEENALLHRQIQAIKQAAIELEYLTAHDFDSPPVICLVCKHKDGDWLEAICVECCNVNARLNWQPPEVGE